jgi:two-component system copper resistance phosphate regulon response regulator CusR
MRILVVEDEPRIAAFLVKALLAHGYATEHVVTGGQALERLGGPDRWSLVLLDLGLPDMDGLDVIRSLRDRGSTLPLIVITARATEREQVLSRGANDFVAKPLSMKHLLDRIAALAA